MAERAGLELAALERGLAGGLAGGLVGELAAELVVLALEPASELEPDAVAAAPSSPGYNYASEREAYFAGNADCRGGRWVGKNFVWERGGSFGFDFDFGSGSDFDFGSGFGLDLDPAEPG